VAQAFAGVNLDNRALPGVYIGVVMGRHAGFLTAASILAQKFPDDGPHLIYLPERTFDPDKFIVDVQAAYDKHGRCVIAVSEGVMGKDGQPIVTTLKPNIEKDSHGNVQLSGTGALGDLLSDLIKAKTKIKRVRSDTLGYLQRSFLGCYSETDQSEAREVGEKAVQFAAWHNVDGSVAMKRVGDYSVQYELLKLTDVAAKTKHMPDDYINAAGNGVTEAFKSYARPLVGELAVMDRISAPAVHKIKND
jgi:6-phosphofructokinase 1